MGTKNELYIGDVSAPLIYFSSAALIEVNGRKTVDLVGNELSIDLLEPRAEYRWVAQQPLVSRDGHFLESSDGYTLFGFYNQNPAEIPYGTPMWYYADGRPAGKYYFQHAERTARTQWIIHAVSIVGLLDVEMHRGGVYTGKDFAHVLTEFFGGSVGESVNGYTYVSGGIAELRIEDAVAITTVHGLLPYASKRENLHQLIFDYCVSMSKTEDGTLVFSYLQPSYNPPQIPEDRIIIGGEINYEQLVTDVELTEYTYVFDETAEPVKIYDNSTAPHTEGEALVLFSTPVKPSTITTSELGMTVRDANEISAYVTGHGVISGVPYQIQERVISRSVDGPVLRRTVSVDGLTLTNPLNSTNLMDRLFNYYTTRRVISAGLKVEDEEPGRLYGFVDPWGEEVTGYIHSMEWQASGITRADCEIITNYNPTGISNNMQNTLLLTGEGVWEVPTAIRERENPYIRAVIIGGGSGGHGGYSGEDSGDRPDKPGAGGPAGEGGEGGKVLVVEINVKNVEAIAYSCGIGGIGGKSDQPGEPGTDTVFGIYNSADGAVVPGGVLNYIDGKFYARTGAVGVPGVAGGQGADIGGNSPTAEELASYGMPGEDIEYKGELWEGGEGGGSNCAVQNGYAGWALGGGGGGAAVGGNGKDGGDGIVQWQAVIGGQGGEGATATKPGADAQYVGTGGGGGDGGGGGGAPGRSGFSAGSAPNGYPGIGGKGSDGGRGAPGGILIYY